MRPTIDELYVWATVWCAIGIFGTSGAFAIANFAGALCHS